MRRRQNLVLFLPVIWLLSQAASCPPAHPDPQARAAQYATEAIQRLGELQDATIGLNKLTPPLVNDKDAIAIVRFTVGAIKTIRQTPYGWGPSVATAYAELRPLLNSHDRLRNYVPLIDVLLKGVQ